jgi:hypothetical protein
MWMIDGNRAVSDISAGEASKIAEKADRKSIEKLG